MLQAPDGVHVIRRGAFEAWLMPLGARLMQVWWLAAPEGPRPLCLGFAHPNDYLADRMSMGSVCGRYGNRIQDAQLTIAGRAIRLDDNHPMGHCIHGGAAGFGWRDWTVASHTDTHLTFSLESPAGDQGFPGHCRARISYQWEDDNVLRWYATATVDEPCPINLVPHPYWNLDGQATIANHRVWIAATQYLPLDDRELPLPLAAVQGTPFDFQQPRCIPIDAIPLIDGALAVAAPASEKLQNTVTPVATCTAGGLTLTLKTDRPFVHLYAAAGLRPQSFIDPATHARVTPQALGVQHQPGAGLCLETEDWPNGPAVGRAEVWYNAEQPYQHTALWQFTTDIKR